MEKTQKPNQNQSANKIKRGNGIVVLSKYGVSLIIISFRRELIGANVTKIMFNKIVITAKEFNAVVVILRQRAGIDRQKSVSLFQWKPITKPEKNIKIAVDDFGVYEEEFSEKLRHCIDEIFDPTVPFSQTKIEKNCEYCQYKSICNR